eukprot:scaffold120731_cov14-Prasinocladus_malaysianus.AAC.1
MSFTGAMIGIWLTTHTILSMGATLSGAVVPSHVFHNARYDPLQQQNVKVRIESIKSPDIFWYCGADLTADQRQQVVAALDVHLASWAKHSGDINPITGGFEFEIELMDEVPFRCSPYRLSHAQTEFLKNWCKQMLDANIIEPAPRARWASPTLLPENKVDASGKYGFRVVHDFRKLNSKTHQYAYQ